MSVPQLSSVPVSTAEDNEDYFKSTINEYLDNLPETVHSQLYKSPETCLAIFRLLPSLAKFYIMTLLFQETAIPFSDLNRWIKNPKPNSTTALNRNPSKIYQNDSIKRLKSLNLLKDMKRQIIHPTTKQPTNVVFVQLNPIFRQSFRDALTGYPPDSTTVQDQSATPTPASTDTPETSDKLTNIFADDEDNKITIDYLDHYCLSKWENILHFMVGSDTNDTPSIGVLTLLRYSGLMELPADRERREILNSSFGANYDPDYHDEDNVTSIHVLIKLTITKNGFQFLLQDINSQIWTLLLQYLMMSEKLHMNPVDVLNFVFLLGSLELGQGYPISMLSKTQQVMLDDLIDYGLIYHNSNSRIFYPTRLSTALTSETTTFKTPSTAIDQEIAQPRTEKSSSQGSIIIETNFKIYCYTSSPLQIAILNLFVHMKARFSNLVVGVITRESVRSALNNGITSEQIINYLEAHAHGGMIKLAEEEYAKKFEFESSIGNSAALEQLKLEILPPTVIDQIKLWQLELDRVQAFKGYLYKDFANEFEFEKLLTYGEEIGVIVWKDKMKRRFFVTSEGNVQLIEYANRIIRNGSNTPRTGTPA